MTEAFNQYRYTVRDYVEAFDRLDLSREEGYCVKLGLFSANLTNFLPKIPEARHESLYVNLQRNLALETFDRQIMSLSDVSAFEGNMSFIDGEAKKPFIFCTFHLGSYRLIANLLIRKGYHFSTLVRQGVYEHQKEEFQNYCEGMHQRFGTPSTVNILNAQDPRVLMKILRELKEGRSLLVYLDASTGSGEENCESIDFLGQQIEVRKGIPYVSYLSGVPILPIVQYRKENLQNVLHVGKPIEAKPNETREAFSKRSIRAVYQSFEKYIARYPDQWEGWNYIHNSLVLPQENVRKISSYARSVNHTFHFNRNRYRIFELEDNYLLFDRAGYQTYEITADLKAYLMAPVVKNPKKILGENVFGELLSKSILI
ncbi:hypothetical protein GCM10027275_23980 [Rhabdobacter roseus]|uniref:KDO2-lipid IV(A) lauroyltransferase n=1 Tax=Rhabdobacter roseus TaxID=1655419 RepID=A0A840TW01_9BACT|nr:hypothetical protein [Rhabdobacter roseus]MBB5284338.1 KDO2-lipid IV(A) lauroyltransferase [Rhabdobacter roseus]